MVKYLNTLTGGLEDTLAAHCVGVPEGAEVATVRGIGIVDFWRACGAQQWSITWDCWATAERNMGDFIRHTGARILWEAERAPADPWQTQVGGDHYRKLAIQPMQYSLANGLDAGQHTVIKYVTRFKDKDGLEGLLKAKQTIDLMIAHYYPEHFE